jgi:HEAT repeat protein
MGLGVCGCAGLWDQVSSNDFKFKDLFHTPEPMTVLRDSTSGDKRAGALRSLQEPLQHGGTQKDQDAYVQILTTAATTDKEHLCRIAAITALAKFKDPRASAALIRADEKAVQDFDREASTRVRQRALAALGESRSPEAQKWLVRVARASAAEEGSSERQQTLDVRLIAIRSLGKYKDPEATEVLLSLIKTDKDVAVRERAHQSLELATGKHLPADAKAWEGELHHTLPPQVPNGTLAEDPTKNRNQINLTGGR